MSHHKHSVERLFFYLYGFFSSLSPCWFFIPGGEWHKLPRKVSYKHAFGAPDQGQMLDVWCWHSADINTEVVVTSGVTISSRKDTLNITRYLRRNLCRSMRSHELDLRMHPVQLTSCTLTLVQNGGSFLGINIDTLTPHMGLCRILHDAHRSQPVGWMPVLIISQSPILLRSTLKSLSLVASTRHASLTLACLLEVGQQA